ncbi:MAG: lipoyl(octanoyl) transferase LipB [Burkholderiales bacterium]
MSGTSTPAVSERTSGRGCAADRRGSATLTFKTLGLIDYGACYAAMRTFTAARDPATRDELWIVEHNPIYTAGVAGRAEHFPRCGSIPLARIDRGGQITYHGPGQAIIYCLVDLARRGITVSAMVRLLEQAVIDVLAAHGTHGERRTGAPGVYVGGAKIAALGLRIRNGRCYHGVALNVSNDLAPFDAIDPCGYPGLRVTRTADEGVAAHAHELGERLAYRIARGICATNRGDS